MQTIDLVSKTIIHIIGGIVGVLATILGGVILLLGLLAVIIGALYVIKLEFSIFFNKDISPRLNKFFDYIKFKGGPAFRKISEPIDKIIDKDETFDPFDKWAQR